MARDCLRQITRGSAMGVRAHRQACPKDHVHNLAERLPDFGRSVRPRCRTSADGHLSHISRRSTISRSPLGENFPFCVKAPAPPARPDCGRARAPVLAGTSQHGRARWRWNCSQSAGPVPLTSKCSACVRSVKGASRRCAIEQARPLTHRTQARCGVYQGDGKAAVTRPQDMSLRPSSPRFTPLRSARRPAKWCEPRLAR